jgi:quercetin dioxygenase-like cupin family protein
MTLQPGEATPWHVDRCHRFTVVVRGERITIEYRGSPATVDVPVEPGQAEWDEPEDAVHRAVNTGDTPFEEVVTFYRAAADEDPQPVC